MSPEQIRALVQIPFNMRHGNIPVFKEVKRNLKNHINALVSLVESSVPYKKKKQTLAQEGGIYARFANSSSNYHMVPNVIKRGNMVCSIISRFLTLTSAGQYKEKS